MQKTQFTLRQYIGKDNIAKLFGQEKANDESFINRKVILISEQIKNFVGSNGGNKRFEFQIEGTLQGFALKCGITPENKDILFGTDIPMLKREQRNVKEMSPIQYHYSKSNKNIDTSWVDKMANQYGVRPDMIVYLSGDDEFYKTLTKYYFDIKDPRVLKALHERYDVDYIIDTYAPDDLRCAVSKLSASKHQISYYLGEYLEQNFLNGKQFWQKVIDVSTAFNDEPNKNQIYAVKRVYDEQIDFDIAQKEQVLFVTEDPAIALAYVQKYTNPKFEVDDLHDSQSRETLTVDVVSLVHDMDVMNRSPKDIMHLGDDGYGYDEDYYNL